MCEVLGRVIGLVAFSKLKRLAPISQTLAEIYAPPPRDDRTRQDSFAGAITWRFYASGASTKS